MNEEHAFCFKPTDAAVKWLCDSDSRLEVLIKAQGVLEYALHNDPYLFFVETIIGQMLSNKVADVITGRMRELCGGDISAKTVATLGRENIRSIGLSGSKADYIAGFTTFVVRNPTFFDELRLMDESAIMHKLTSIRGIGNWTAKMYLIFSLNKMDVLPFEDGAFLQVYRWMYQTDDVSPKSIMQRCGPWKPYSSIAARYLYRALDNGLLRDRQTIEAMASLPPCANA